MTVFVLVYDSLWKKPHDSTETPKEEKQEKVKYEEKENPKKPDKSAMLQQFQKDAEANMASEIDARLVCLTADGGHPEMSRKVSSSRLYENLTSVARFVCFFDVKNARLVERRDDEFVYQREPKVDMEQFPNSALSLIFFCRRTGF